LYITEKEGEDEERAEEEDIFSASRGVRSSASGAKERSVLERTPRAAPYWFFSVSLSSSPFLSIKKIEPEAAFAVVVSTSYAAFAVI
jgi:hypothetical protein